MTELEDCPFCGEQAETFEGCNRVAGHGDSSDEVGVKCTGCGVSFSDRNYSGYQVKERIEDAKRKWNTRTKTN